MIKKCFLAVVVLLFIVNNLVAQQTGETKGWPSMERYVFLSECINSAKSAFSEDSARFYCFCMQEKIENAFPTVEAAATITAETMQTPEWTEEVKKCLQGTWSDEQRIALYQKCISSDKFKLEQEKKIMFCECMVYKAESRYPDAFIADKITVDTFNSPEWKNLLKGCLEF